MLVPVAEVVLAHPARQVMVMAAEVAAAEDLDLIQNNHLK